MRGEEVQLLGAAAAGLVNPDSWLCQPGTHAKWARLAGGELVDFTTAMTGEIFAQLGKGGLLIGSDCSARLDGDFAGARADGVDVLASPALGALYLAALNELGCKARLVDSHAAFLAGITQIWSLLA